MTAHTIDHRPEDEPDVVQRRASSPHASVWVGASAGTGKTKVLTDRILRLLLPDLEAGRKAGTAPHRILCITFTKAAAAEMAARLSQRLGAWAIASDDSLRRDLTSLYGRPSQEVEEQAARRLFAEVVDAPEGVRIMTIHSFCQSILSRFPIEAGLWPNFEALDDARSGVLLDRAQARIFRRVLSEPDSPLAGALSRLTVASDIKSLRSQIIRALAERTMLRGLEIRTADELRAGLLQMQGLPATCTIADIMHRMVTLDSNSETRLREAVSHLSTGGKTDTARADAIQAWLDSDPSARQAGLEDYLSAYLTEKGEIQKRLATQAVKKACPDIEDWLREEAERLLAVQGDRLAVTNADLTSDFMCLVRAVLEEYEAEKLATGALDFDDLIAATLGLLRGDGAAQWILYKLDGGLSHILIDEAQDTNPDQWEIVRLLTAELTAGSGREDPGSRTLFTVGDVKQSIYSFQRADPVKFGEMRTHFRQAFDQVGAPMHDVPMTRSFRSTASVLELVDAVFRGPEMLRSLGLSPQDAVRHSSHRTGQAGRVELWPLFETPEKEERAPWQPLRAPRTIENGQQKLCSHIADTIRRWLDEGEMLPALGRRVTPGDILILVRNRGKLVPGLVRALKQNCIPLSGADRMVLGKELAVQDVMALARISLLPEDDLTLACVLKSPLIGLDEDALFDLCAGRKGGLIQTLAITPGYEPVMAYLRRMQIRAGTLRPYEFFSEVLSKPCPADPEGSGLRALHRRLGDDALDPIEEFLAATLAYEDADIPTLQGFLSWPQAGEMEIKRGQEEGGDRVRIMTVHGSKGLQAPIVILAETAWSQPPGQGEKSPRLLLPDPEIGMDLPLWCPRSDEAGPLYRKARERNAGRQLEELQRLLYVALTRAADRLYIAGAVGVKGMHETSWYRTIRTAMESLPVTTLEDGSLRLDNPQTAPARPSSEESVFWKPAATFSPPDWLHRPLPEEASPPRPLTPSRPSGSEQPAASPLAGADTDRFQRGIVTHKLLEILPDLPQESWEEISKRFVSLPVHDLPQSVQEGIIAETLAILRHPEFGSIFGPGSMAEVPVTGMVSGGRRIMSGQIDRLLVEPDRILILDYKTNRPPPLEESGVPEAYRDQLRAYRDAVAAIYPGREIRCALLWTDGPRLMPVTL